MSGDLYIDLETGVLRNRLDITDAAELAQAESELTSYRLIELRRTGLSGRYDLAHLQAFHRYIFGDLYNWAGERFIREITAVWTGVASDAFQSAVAEWNEAARDMRDELSYLLRFATTAHNNHALAVRTNIAMWRV